jgi:PAS domain S-box-containing protein
MVQCRQLLGILIAPLSHLESLVNLQMKPLEVVPGNDAVTHRDSPVGVVPAEIPAATEAMHLRRLLETQPGCLLRLSAEGTLLAVNDAGVNLLGADDRTQLLGQSLTSYIASEASEAWTQFLARTAGGAPSSIECELVCPDGGHRTVVFHGVPIVEPMDGIASVLLTAHDRSVWLRVDAALQYQVENQPALLTRSQAELGKLKEEYCRDREAHESRAREYVAKLEAVEAKLVEATAERERLARTVTSQEAAHQRLLAEHEVEQVQVERVLAQAVSSRERWGRHVDGVCAELEAIAASIEDRLSALLDISEVDEGPRVALAALRHDAASITSLIRRFQEGPAAEHASGGIA